MFPAKEKTDCPCILFWDHSNAVFFDHRGRVSDPSVSFLSRGVTFGHSVCLLHSDTRFEMKTLSATDHDTVTYIKDELKPEAIREKRYTWRSSDSVKHPSDPKLPIRNRAFGRNSFQAETSYEDFPKVLVDNRTGKSLFFSPAYNVVRHLGPDFDCNPMNYPDYKGDVYIPAPDGGYMWDLRLYLGMSNT